MSVPDTGTQQELRRGNGVRCDDDELCPDFELVQLAIATRIERADRDLLELLVGFADLHGAGPREDARAGFDCLWKRHHARVSLGVNRATDQTRAEPTAPHAVVHHHLASQTERLGALAKLVVRSVDEALRDSARGKITECVVCEGLESLRCEVFEAILGGPMLQHAFGNRDDIAGVDHASPAEHSALEDAHREIVSRSPSAVHVELVVHPAVPLSSLRTDEITTLLQHDDVVTGLGQKARRGCARRSPSR